MSLVLRSQSLARRRSSCQTIDVVLQLRDQMLSAEPNRCRRSARRANEPLATLAMCDRIFFVSLKRVEIFILVVLGIAVIRTQAVGLCSLICMSLDSRGIWRRDVASLSD